MNKIFKIIIRSLLCLLSIAILFYFNRKLPISYGEIVFIGEYDGLMGTELLTLYDNDVFEYSDGYIDFNGTYKVKNEVLYLDYYFPPNDMPEKYVVENDYINSYSEMNKKELIHNLLVVKNDLFLINEITQIDESRILSHEVNPKEERLKLYWKNDKGENFKNFKNLKDDLEDKGEELTFAMNGGMYLKDLSPQGYFVENGVEKKSLNRIEKAFGNFYMQPNGVFYIKNNNNAYVSTKEELPKENLKYATQSGPMLVIDGVLHPKFKKGSNNLHIRNGVGVLPNGNLLFAISKERINFYDFASYFKQKGCKDALYLDGFVSRMYLPSKNWEQTDGNFGVIIAESIKNKK